MIRVKPHRFILLFMSVLSNVPSGFADTSSTVVLSGKMNTSEGESDSETFDAFLCDAAVLSENAADGVQFQVQNSAIERVRFTLGSDRYGAAYSATLCLTSGGKNSAKKNDGKNKAMTFSLTLGSSNVIDAHSSYLELSQLMLIAHIVCADNSIDRQLYNGPFQDLAVTISWKMAVTDTTCRLILTWQETSTALRSWVGAPTAITGFLSADPKE